MPARRRLLWLSLALSMGLLALALGSAQPPVDPGNAPPPPNPVPASAPLMARITVPATTPGGPYGAPGPGGPAGAPAAGGPAGAPAAPVRRPGGRPKPAGPPVVRARLGQRVELAVTPPGPDAISIPGFDRTGAGSPGTPATFSLVAYRAGRFPLVLKSSGQTVGVLEIGIDAHPSAHPVRKGRTPRPPGA